ncbi:cytochrome P450 71AU50-like [Nicotiana sylvestris]|uniref:cytochrome P450 71AU50-like n=1 Tax=Nicotiana sylvestris TaxID=4096 RepID=UPI00388C805B
MEFGPRRYWVWYWVGQEKEKSGLSQVRTILKKHAQIVHSAIAKQRQDPSISAYEEKELEILVNFLKQAASEGIVIDLSAKVASLSANMSCLMIFGRKYMDEDLGDKGFKALIQDILHIAAMPNFVEFFPFLRVFDLQRFTRRMKELAKLFDEFLERVIYEHVQYTEEQKQAKDMVDTLMSIMQSKEAEFEFDRRHVKAILLDLLIASMDTSSTTIKRTLIELLRHPEVMKKIPE